MWGVVLFTRSQFSHTSPVTSAKWMWRAVWWGGRERCMNDVCGSHMRVIVISVSSGSNRLSSLSHILCKSFVLCCVVLCCFSSSHTVWRRIHSLRLLLASESAIPSWFINLSKLCELHPRLVFDLLERIHIVQKSSINTDRVRFYTFRWKLRQMSSMYSFIMKWTRLLTLHGVLFSYKSSPANASAHADICDVILWCVCVCL